jgi:hypothetical protein
MTSRSDADLVERLRAHVPCRRRSLPDLRRGPERVITTRNHIRVENLYS